MWHDAQEEEHDDDDDNNQLDISIQIDQQDGSLSSGSGHDGDDERIIMQDASEASMSLSQLLFDMEKDRKQKHKSKGLPPTMDDSSQMSSSNKDDHDKDVDDDMSGSHDESDATFDSAAETERKIRNSFLFAICSMLGLVLIGQLMARLCSCWGRKSSDPDAIANDVAAEVQEELTDRAASMLLVQQSSQSSSSSMVVGGGPVPVPSGGGAEQA